MSLGVCYPPPPSHPISPTNPLQGPWIHNLTAKFTAAAEAGTPAIELFFEDLLHIATSLPSGPTPSNQLLAAR